MKTISLDIESEDIVFADLTDREVLEVVIVCKSGRIFRFDCQTSTVSFLKDLPFASYKLELRLYGFLDYVCIVQNKGTDGTVLRLTDRDYRKDLIRGDYCAYASPFPVAFYAGDGQIFLIHGTDWNRLDITHLEADRLLTDRFVDYETDSNYFDYFHGSLFVSPDSQSFISSGWVWHPYELITFYSIEEFLRNFENSHQPIDFEMTSGYNWERPICWIDEKTLAVGYNRREDGETKGEVPSEIVFVDVSANKITDRVRFDGFSLSGEGEVGGTLFFDRAEGHFIGLNKQNGLLIIDMTGREKLKDCSLTAHKYSPRHNLIYRIDNKNRLLEMESLRA